MTRTPLKLWLVPCNPGDTEQKWFFTQYDEEGIPHPPQEDQQEDPRDEL